ncbi:uncharacterized protein LOC129645560 [Bubalus kerabau]|uniref:protein transport protein SEC31-like n=1 Tax=Bubalus bubalis TaxID=89462 RepID=UPI001D108D3F|nr:protein transport protein SEC31-like [Bubalus bubalis]XP_055426828.1 uncharacterized protein LOC129645560 [Bubalus carabanensis]XP_055426829.1 uncharacterized protein LOC129645560 [Bubalus carabanensis]
MGGSVSKATVLECVIKNFKKGFEDDYGVNMTPNRLRIFCEVERPSLGIGWPPEGTMDLKTIKAVSAVVTGTPEQPDQYPYIDSWLWLARDPPPRARLCIQKERGKTLMAQKSTDDKKEILQDPDGSDLPSPPYWMTRRPPNAPPGPEAALMTTDPGPAGAPPVAPGPITPEIVELPSRQAPIPAVGTSSQRPQDSASAEPPKQYPPLPVSTDGRGEGDTGIRPRLRSTKEPGESVPQQVPRRELQQPVQQTDTTTSLPAPTITNHFPLWTY